MSKEDIIKKFSNSRYWIGDLIGKQEMGEAVIEVVGVEGFKYEVNDRPKQLKLGFRFYKEKDSENDITFFYPIREVRADAHEKSLFERVCEKLEEHYKKHKE